MRVLSVLVLFVLAGCARPVSQAASPMPMAAGCPMMHGGGMPAMAGMAMAAPSDSGAAHTCPCPMHAGAHAMAHDTGTSTGASADSTHAMAGCPMCSGGHCPMHAPTPPEAATHAH